MVAFLLARGADANRTVPGSRHEGYGTPLSLALLPQSGAPHQNDDVRRLKAVSLLLDAGADVEARDRKGRTILHVVASHGDLKAVELLLSGDATVNVPDAQGVTPLHVAVRNGHAAVAALLLDRGADVRVKARDQTSPLDLAARDPEMEALVRRYASR
jgi:ankyrin repeat protein